MARQSAVFLWVAVATFGMWSLAATDMSWHQPYPPDGASDKYTALAAWTGGDPHQPMSDLVARYGYHSAGSPAPHPRPPGALLLQGPMILLDDAAIIPVMGAVTVAGILFTCWASARLARVWSGWFALLAFWVLGTTNFWWAGSSTLIAPGVAAAILLMARHPSAAGVCLGVLSAVRLWPSSIVAALLWRRHRSGFVGVVSTVGLTALGLLLPGTSIKGTFDALSRAGSYFAGSTLNTNPVVGWGGPIVAAVVGGVLWVVVVGLARTDVEAAGLSLVAGLVASPLVWSAYWLAAVPAVAAATRSLTDRLLGDWEGKQSDFRGTQL